MNSKACKVVTIKILCDFRGKNCDFDKAELSSAILGLNPPGDFPGNCPISSADSPKGE